MVPPIWAFFSADVSAGTASAARMAMMAITTNNSIRVNAEEVLFVLFIFIGVCFEVARVISLFTNKVNTYFLTFFEPRSHGLPATTGRLWIARTRDGWQL